MLVLIVEHYRQYDVWVFNERIMRGTLLVTTLSFSFCHSNHYTALLHIQSTNPTTDHRSVETINKGDQSEHSLMLNEVLRYFLL